MPITISDEATVGVAAAQIVNQLNTVYSQISALLETGMPARQGVAAIPASTLKKALGAANVAKLEAVRDALAD